MPTTKHEATSPVPLFLIGWYLALPEPWSPSMLLLVGCLPWAQGHHKPHHFPTHPESAP